MANSEYFHEIDSRLRRRYLDRAAQRIRKMRRQLIDRDWDALRIECTHLRDTGESFGFERIAELATLAAHEIPAGHVSRLQTLPAARVAVESLISTIDVVLSENGVLRFT